MGKRKRYTDDFRASAVLMLEAAGYPETEGALARVSAHLNVPHSTLHRWFHGKQNPPPSNLVQDIKRDAKSLLDNLFFGLGAELLRRIDSGDIQDESLQHVLNGLGITYDKRSLLSGGPTERVDQTGTITVEYRDEGGLKLPRPEWQDDAERLMQ